MAPTPTIPSATSVVDYLNTKKQDSSFGARKKLYSEMGFDKRLGDFVGGANQNLALLRELQKKDSQVTATDVVSPGAPVEAPVVGNVEPQFKINTPITKPTVTPAMTSTPMSSSDLLKSVGFQDVAPPAPPTTATEVVATPDAPAIQSTTAPGMKTPEEFQANDSATLASSGTSAASLYPEVFGEEKDITEADFINNWLNSPEGKLFTERQKLAGMQDEALAESTKKELESRYEADKVALEEKLAANGLAFSGIRGTKVKALADALAASELEVDRELASKLLDGNLDLRDAILDGVASLAKEAQDGRKEAIQQLNAIGYAVIDGQLVPTLSARSGERAERSLELSEQRLALAEESAARGGSSNKLTLSEATSRGLPSYLVGTSEEEVANSFYDEKPPAWFARKVQEDNGKTLPEASIQKLWDQQAPNYRTGVKQSENFTKASKFFGAFPGTSPEVANGYANRVEFYVNGGNSYADALKKVQDDINKTLKDSGQKKIDWKKISP